MSETISLDEDKTLGDAEPPAVLKDNANEDFNVSKPEHCYAHGTGVIRDVPTIPCPETAHTSIPNNRQNATSRKAKLFGLNKRSSADKQPQADPTLNRFDYEQKYPPDRFGEELAPNARVWLTYLDEADAYDRDKVEGWKDTVDVLLVFTGLFSAIVSTFVVQSSQSLQQDFTQTSASLLFEMVQLQRAQISGTPITNVPDSTLTPFSPFSPSTNATLVNGLWFASLTISLSTALFAVLAKQWIYYYMSTISGTARDRVRVRHFRFQGLEKWKVGFIIDLLPIFLHLALGVFLIGLILLVLPLNIRIAWAVIILSGSTYVSYFISVALPIWYADCPYTTSLTIYLRNVLYLGVPIFRVINFFVSLSTHLSRQRVFRTVCHPIQNLYYVIGRINGEPVNAIQRNLRKALVSIKRFVFGDAPFKLTSWREEKLNRSIENTDLLNLKALHWLHTISTNSSIQRIIARSISVYPKSIEESGLHFESFGFNFVDLNEADVEYYYRSLSPQLRFPLNPNPFSSSTFSTNIDAQVDEERLPDCVNLLQSMRGGNYIGILLKAFNDNDGRFRAPLVIWRRLLSFAPKSAMLVAHMLSYESKLNPFHWNVIDEPANERNGITLLGLNDKVKELNQARFQYLSCYFCGSELPVAEGTVFKSRYQLFVAIYHNLISDQPFITDQAPRQDCLKGLFDKVTAAIFVEDADLEKRILTSEFLNRFSRDILCVEGFWGPSMTNDLRVYAVYCVERFWKSHNTNTGDVRSLFSAEDDRELRFIYRWCSQELASVSKTITLHLFMPNNLRHLGLILRHEPPDETVANFRRCLAHLQHIASFGLLEGARLERRYIVPNLVHVLKPASSHPLLSVFYHPSVLVELWVLFYTLSKAPISHKEFFSVINSKLDSEDLKRLYHLMVSKAKSIGNNRCEKAFGMTGSRRFLRILYKSICFFGKMIEVPDSEFVSSVPIDQVIELGFRDASEILEAFSWEFFKEERKRSSFLSHRALRIKQVINKSAWQKSLDREIEMV